MGLATIDPHSLKEHTEIYKIPKFGGNRPNSKHDTAIWKCQNLQRNVWRAGQLSADIDIETEEGAIWEIPILSIFFLEFLISGHDFKRLNFTFF